MKYCKVCGYLDSQYGCETASKLSGIGNENSLMGFRNAGSTGEKKAAMYIEDEMRKIGLKNVNRYPFEVDSWEFRGAVIEFSDRKGFEYSYALSSFAGLPGTGSNGISAHMVDAGYGTYDECKDLDLKGAVAFIRLDMDREYWLGVPVYQLELMGAVAVITVMEGDSYGKYNRDLNSANGAARTSIPVLNISRENGHTIEALLKNQVLEVDLKADITISKGESCNITGSIPGKLSDRYILLGAHYDGYFNAYIDDALGIGAVLNIAQAILRSGVIPKYTIVFIAHGAEEFGVCDSHYDWCIGSWKQITQLKPDWKEKVRLFLNIDAANPDSKELLVQASPQIHHFLNKCLAQKEDEIKREWRYGFKVNDVNGTWSDDFSYYMAGIPVVIAGRGKSEWRNKYYHTDFDTNESLYQVLMKNISEIYSLILCEYDEAEDAPVDVNEEVLMFENTLDKDLLKGEGIDIGRLDNQIAALKARNGFSAYMSNNLIKAIRAIDFDDNIIFKLEEKQKNIKILNKISQHLKEGDFEEALMAMKMFCGNSVIEHFQDEVYQYYYVDAVDDSKKPLQWGFGIIEKPLDIRRLFRVFKRNDFDNVRTNEVQEEIRNLKNKEIEIIKNHLKNTVKTLEALMM